MKTVISVCSARPNFVKLAAVHHALEETCAGSFEHVIVHTGQHYDPLFSDIFFEQLRISQPAFNLGVKGGERDAVIAATQAAFEETLPKIDPDIVLVYGDVSGAVGAAMAAKAGGWTIGHVEAGLRSFDPAMPEELNRIQIDRIADLLFCSEQSGMDNLEREKIEGERHLVGNTMIDTLVRMQSAIDLEELPPNLPARYAVATLHRPSNVDDPAMLQRNVKTLLSMSERVGVVLPVHHRLKAALEQHHLLGLLSERVRLLPPLGYLPFLRLLRDARFILTDSGGIQEEATFLRKRCYTLRKNTERPATIESGSNVLIDLERPADRVLLERAADEHDDPVVRIPELWDGKAGERIVRLLAKRL